MTTARYTILFCAFLAAVWACAQSNSTRLLIYQGDSLLEAGQGAKAMQKYNAAVAADASAEALAARARGWYFQGKFPKFLADVDRSLALDSLHPQANFQRAQYAARTEDHAATIRYTTKAMHGAMKPTMRRQALILRGEAEAASGKPEQAIEDLREGIDDRLEEYAALKVLAKALDDAGRPAESLEVMEKLCAAQPNDIANWSNKGFELNRLERYTEAAQALDRALELDKDEPVVLSNKAFTLLKLDRDEEAMTLVNRSLRGDAANPYALRTRALLYLRKGDREKACNDLSLSKAMGASSDVDGLIKQNCAGIQPKR